MKRWYPRMRRATPRAGIRRKGAAPCALLSPKPQVPSPTSLPRSLAPRQKVGPQLLERRPIRLPTGPNHYVPRRQMVLQFPPPDLFHPAPQSIAPDAGFLCLGHDQPEAGGTRLIAGPEDVEVRPAQTVSCGQYAANFGGAGEPARARKALAAVRRVRASNRWKL